MSLSVMKVAWRKQVLPLSFLVFLSHPRSLHPKENAVQQAGKKEEHLQ